MFPAMATNGYTISKKKVCNKFVDAGLKFIQISVDGVDPYTHDSFRGVTGAWENAINAVENCVNADIFVEVATTVTEHNYNEIPDLIDFARDLGANWFMIYNFIPTGNGADIVNMDLSPQKRSNLLKKAYKENSKGEMQILSTAPQYAMVAESLISQESSVIPTHFYNPEYSNSTVKQIADFVGGCGAGRFYMSIEPNGDMYPCVFFPHEYELKLGNLLKDNFQDVWTNNKLLKTLRNKEILEGHCGECESKEKCGGCRARAFNYFHDVLAPDPGCVNHTEEWNQIRSNLVADTYEELANGILVDLD
jgi:radical SAM protein with 4Fe4S-binding SPASM domain